MSAQHSIGPNDHDDKRPTNYAIGLIPAVVPKVFWQGRAIRTVLLCCALTCFSGCVAPATPGPAASTNSDSAAVADTSADAEDANQAIAAGVAGSDIWIGRLKQIAGGWMLGGLVNASKRPGYDNQPAFSADGYSIYYSSIRDGTQADVYRYYFAESATRQVTKTRQSEFSPVPMPARAGISTVRVEADGRQLLAGYDIADNSILMAEPATVGYYTWLDTEHVAMFLVEDPPRLVIATVPGGQLQTVALNAGRSLHGSTSGRQLRYVDKNDPERWWITEYDLDTGQTTAIAETLPGSEDFAWSADGAMLMASGRKIYRWQAGWKAGWQPIIDLEKRIPGAITRMALHRHGEWLAFVAAEAME